MSNDKVAATFHHPDEEPDSGVETGQVPKRRPRAFRPDLRTETQQSMTPDDPSAVPHAHMDEH